MNVLVTGAAGFIGSHVCEALFRAHSAVVGLDNTNPFYDPQLKRQNLLDIEKTAAKLGVEFIFYEGDIRHQDLVAEILQRHDIDVIVHLAAMAGVRPSFESPLLYADVNYNGTMTLLEEARKRGSKYFVFASSSAVYGNTKTLPFKEDADTDHPISPYAASKRAAEIACSVYHHNFGMNIATLRFFTVYGPRQRPDLAINKFTRLILAGTKLPVYGDGSKARDFTYIDDIVDGALKAITWVCGDGSRYEIFNFGESQTTSVRELIRLLSQTLSLPADIQYLPDIFGDVDKTFADISKSRRILGYNPKTDLRAGLEKYVKWAQAKPGINF